MDEGFGTLLRDLLTARGIGINEFARKTGTSAATVSRFIRGKRESRAEHGGRQPVSAMFEAWADVLGLRGKERGAFIERAWLATSPPEVRRIVDDLRAELERARSKR